MVINMNNSKEVKRYDFGVVVDLLPDVTARKIRDRVTDVRDQAVRMNYQSLDAAAQQLYEARAIQESMYGVRKGSKPATFSGQKFHLLCSASGVLVLTHRFAKVKWEVSTALAHGTKVAILKPFSTPDMVKLNSVADWELMCEREANPDWSLWMDELDITLTSILNTPTPWMECATLGGYAATFESFDMFLDALQTKMHDIEAEGEWDVDMSNSVVYNEKASVAHYVANKGMDKGKRTCSSSYKYGKKEFWYNYEVLPVDIMTKFLHVSFLHSIDYKPMQRITSNGAEYGTRQYFEFLSEQDMEDGMYEQGLTVTPLYEDPYFEHEIADYDFN